MTNVPNWWALLLLALAAWRTYRLLSEDTILEKPRRWVVNLDQDWDENTGEQPNDGYRLQLATFITCPYCAGFWISLTWWAAWLMWPHATLLASAPLAINAILIAAAKLDER